MTIEFTLNNIGLLLDILGIILLAFFSTITSKYNKEGSFTFGGFDAENGETIIKKYNRDLAITRISYALIILGFVLQMITNNPSSHYYHKKCPPQDKAQQIQVK